MWQRECEESLQHRESPFQESLATDSAQGNYAHHNNQMDSAVASHEATHAESFGPGVQTHMQESRGGGRDLSARIRASITRLMEMEEVCLDPAKAPEKRKVCAEQAFHAKVDQLEAESKIAHQEYYNRLQNVYSSSTTKKMRLAVSPTVPTSETESQPSSLWQTSHEALDTLAVAAVTDLFNEPGVSLKQATVKLKQTKRRQNSVPASEESGVERPVQVHDPTLVKAIDKLAGKLTQLLNQMQATSDEVAAEPILAAAAKIALEVTEMGRFEAVALTRMVEIEQHRQKIMLGLLEYAKRKEQREKNEDGI